MFSALYPMINLKITYLFVSIYYSFIRKNKAFMKINFLKYDFSISSLKIWNENDNLEVAWVKNDKIKFYV